MKKLLSVLLTAAIVSVSSFTAFADKSNPLKSYDFNNQDKGEITYSASPAHYFSESFESGIGGKDAQDYAYKITAKQQGSQSGSYSCTVTVPTGGTSDTVTAEFDLFSNITAKAGAKGGETPSILLYASDKNILYIKQTAIQSVLESWKSVNSDTSYIGSWAKMALTVNKTAKTADMYMNGVKILNGVSLGSNYTDKAYIMLGWNYWYDAPGDNCFFALDNILTYDGAYVPAQVGFKAPSANGYAVDNDTAVITVPAFATVAEFINNVEPMDGCTLTVTDKNGTDITNTDKGLNKTKVAKVVNTDGEYKTYSFNVSNQLAYDDFDSWTGTSWDCSGATAIGQITGTDSIPWRCWNTNTNGEIRIKTEAERGKVIEFYSDETDTDPGSGQSVSLELYTNTNYLNAVPTFGKTLVISCDMYAEKLSGPIEVLGKDGNDKWLHILKLEGEQLGDSSKNYGKAYNNRWYNLMNIINPKDGTWEMYVDGVLAGTGKTDAYSKNLSMIRIALDRVKGEKRTAKFDNFAMYEFDNRESADISAFLTNITSNTDKIKVGKGSLKNIITAENGTSVSELKAALSSATGASVYVSGNDGDAVTKNTEVKVVSANGFNTAEYKVADSSGIVDFDFTGTGGYISADCEYAGEEKPVMVTAMYNNGVLVSVGVGEDDGSKNINGYLSNGIKISKDTEWTEIRAFIFDNMNSIRPLVKDISYSR